MAENMEAPWRLEVPAEWVADSLGSCYLSCCGELWETTLVQPESQELVAAQ